MTNECNEKWQTMCLHDTYNNTYDMPIHIHYMHLTCSPLLQSWLNTLYIMVFYITKHTSTHTLAGYDYNTYTYGSR